MPPRSHSRHLFTQGIRDERGRLFLSERTPFNFRELSDTRRHTVVQGDTLWSLAGRYFAPLPRACGFWWAIADFQPEPILDPTDPLSEGRVLFIPSIRALTDVILRRPR